MLIQNLAAPGRSDVTPALISAQRHGKSRRSFSAIGLLAPVSLLSACATGPGSPRPAMTGETRVETVRELRHFGPQGKSAPIFVTRELQTRSPAGVGAESPVRDR